MSNKFYKSRYENVVVLFLCQYFYVFWVREILIFYDSTTTYITKIIPKKFPNFVATSITIHNDEFSYDRKGNRVESPLHFHVVGIFVAHALTPEELKEKTEYRKKAKEEKRLA